MHVGVNVVDEKNIGPDVFVESLALAAARADSEIRSGINLLLEPRQLFIVPRERDGEVSVEAVGRTVDIVDAADEGRDVNRNDLAVPARASPESLLD